MVSHHLLKLSSAFSSLPWQLLQPGHWLGASVEGLVASSLLSCLDAAWMGPSVMQFSSFLRQTAGVEAVLRSPSTKKLGIFMSDFYLIWNFLMKDLTAL